MNIAPPGLRHPSNWKRSILIHGHKSSVSLEDDFWDALIEIANARQLTLSALMSSIDDARANGNLSSTIRLFVFAEVREGRPGPKPLTRPSPRSRGSSFPLSGERRKGGDFGPALPGPTNLSASDPRHCYGRARRTARVEFGVSRAGLSAPAAIGSVRNTLRAENNYETTARRPKRLDSGEAAKSGPQDIRTSDLALAGRLSPAWSQTGVSYRYSPSDQGPLLSDRRSTGYVTGRHLPGRPPCR